MLYCVVLFLLYYLYCYIVLHYFFLGLSLWEPWNEESNMINESLNIYRWMRIHFDASRNVHPPIFNHLSIIVQVNGRCVLSQCLSMPVSLTAPDGAVESLLDAVLPDTHICSHGCFWCLPSCTAVLSHDFRPAASKGESLVLRFYTSLFQFNLLD